MLLEMSNVKNILHTASPDDPMERQRGLRAPSAGMLAIQGKGAGTSPTCGVVV
jgi:hypothetical protein